MEVVFVLLPLALVVAGVMLALFIWAVRSGQYDDLETPAVRILFDDQAAPGAATVPPDGPSEVRRDPETDETTGERIKVR